MSNTVNYNEMLVHVPLCSHKIPKNILIITDDNIGINREIKRYDNMEFTLMASKKINDIANLPDKSFDVIIFDIIINLDKAFLENVNRITKFDALIVNQITNFMENLENTRKTMQILGKYFRIVMPYSFDTNTKDQQRSTLIFSSKFFHPTADVILDRVDMIDNLSYYNCDIHLATFVQPNYVRAALKGVALN